MLIGIPTLVMFFDGGYGGALASAPGGYGGGSYVDPQCVPHGGGASGSSHPHDE
jgi:hypothetical protein